MPFLRRRKFEGAMVFALRSVGRRVYPGESAIRDVQFEQGALRCRAGLTKETTVLLQQPIRRRAALLLPPPL